MATLTPEKTHSTDTSASPHLSGDEVTDNKLLTFPVKQSNKSRFFGKLRYWWSWFVAGSLIILVAAPAMIFLQLINRRMWLYPLCKWGAKTWLNACGAKVTVSGLENVDPNRSYVFASNHRSYLDTATLFFYAGSKMGLVAKKELLKVPIFGQGMSFVNIIAIDRSNPERAMESMRKAKQVMDEGYSFGVFVEGTRAMPGELLPFKKGAFHLAFQTESPIIPVAIKNTDSMMGKRTGVAYGGEIEMILLPPIETAGLDAENHLINVMSQTREAVASELAKASV